MNLMMVCGEVMTSMDEGRAVGTLYPDFRSLGTVSHTIPMHKLLNE